MHFRWWGHQGWCKQVLSKANNKNLNRSQKVKIKKSVFRMMSSIEWESIYKLSKAVHHEHIWEKNNMEIYKELLYKEVIDI